MFRETYKDAISGYEKFWERKNSDRPVLNFAYEKKGGIPLKKPESLEQKWLDEEFIIENYKKFLTNVGYVAEGVPNLFTNLGPGSLAACIGGSYGLADNTIWFDEVKFITDWENPPEIAINENSKMWQNVLRLQKRYAKEPDINFSVADIGGIMDIIAALRSTEDLLFDLYDYPDEVIAFSQKVKKLWYEAFNQQVESVKNHSGIYNTWMNIPSLKPWYPLQCDFCYMLSPEHFEKFVLGDLAEMANYLERSIYHLDGVGELPHVNMLLDINKLGGIQWTAGDGQAPLWDEKWYPLYKKIQDKNKNIVLIGGVNENNIEGAERLVKTLDPTGLYISADFTSREKAEDMAEKITRWCE